MHMFNISLFTLCVSATWFTLLTAMSTTHAPHMHHSTREPSESDSALFQYDPHGDVMVMKQRSTCYFVPLTSAEQQIVHTSDGLRHLELVALQRVTSGAQKGITGNILYRVSDKILRFCDNSALTLIDI